MDWTAYKKVLLDEYREDYPHHTKEQEAAFYTAMTWLENEMDIDATKQRIIELLDKQNPNFDSNTRDSFIYGLERMSLVINEISSISSRLNDYLPERIHNEYLKKTLYGVKELVALNEQLKDDCRKALEKETKAVNELKTWKQLSKADLKALRMETAYIDLEEKNASLKKEINGLKEFRDKLLNIINVWMKEKEEI